MAIAIYDRFITKTTSGQTIPGAIVSVKNTAENGGGLVDLWVNIEGTLAADNPFTADTNGRAQFYVEEGTYDIQAASVDGVIDYPNVVVLSGSASDESAFSTVENLIISDMSSIATGQIVETKGYSSEGDGGAAQWRKTGVTGLAVSQSPAQLGDAKLSDALGHEWELIIVDGVINAKSVGVLADGSTDDTAARQAMYTAFASTGGIAKYPIGTTIQSSELVKRSKTVSKGAGVGLTVFGVSNSMPLTMPMYRNANIPINRVRQDSDIGFEDLTIDGAGRSYIAYPDASYATKGPCLSFRGVINPFCNRVEIINHESNGGIEDLGCLNMKITNCIAHDNGKDDDISSPIYVQSFGGVRLIVGITKANPAVVTLNSNPPGSVSNGSKVYIEEVTGLASVPDGEYTVANLSGRTFELNGIDTSADSGFIMNHRAIMGEAGGTSNFVPSENTIIDNYHAYDNVRSAVTFNPVKGGSLSGEFRDNGESTIFSAYAKDIDIDCSIDGTTLTDIASSGVELNYCAGVKARGSIANTALDGVSILGCNDVDVDVSLRDIVRDNSILYPVKPLAVASGIDGTTVDKLDGVVISSLLDTPCVDIRVRTTQTDYRSSPQARSCVALSKAGTDNIVSDVSIENGKYANSGISPSSQIQCLAGNVALPHKVDIYRNQGHGSQGKVVQQYTASSTGLVNFNVGFVPSMIEVTAIQLSATNARTAHSFIVRDRTNITSGTLGVGQYQAADGLESSSTVDITSENNITTNDFYRLTNGAGTTIALAEFAEWLCDSSNIGVAMNVITATTSVRLTLVFHP